jgi:hypothetical protein
MVEINTTHVERGTEKLLGQFQGKPRIEALLASRLRQVQALEDAAWEVAFGLNIESGIGLILDNIGKIVGRGRAGLLDADYRYALRCQVRINRAAGQDPDFYDVAALSQMGEISIQEYPPAKFIVTMLEAPTSLGALAVIEENFRQCRALGVGAGFAYTVAAGQENAALWGWDLATYDDADGLAHGAAWDLTSDDGGLVSDIVAL